MYQPTETRKPVPWAQVAFGATAAAAIVALAHSSSAVPQSMYTATSTVTRPATMVAPQFQMGAEFRGQALAAAAEPSMAAYARGEPATFVVAAPAASSPIVNSAAWLAIGAGVSFILAAVATAMRKTAAPLATMQPVPMHQAPKMAMAAVAGYKAPPANLTLSVYDHCPYCTRVELFLGWNGIKYKRVLYGYGDMQGPVKLTGKKVLPVLQGSGVYCPPGMIGMPESMEIIAWAAQEYGLVLPVATGRSDIAAWQKKAKAPIAALSRPRMVKMPYLDFASKEDTDYAFAKWAKKTGFVLEEAFAQTPELLVEMEALLLELEPMIRGEASVMPWGLGMDDILLLPDLRRLTCVKGLKWPPKVEAYVNKALDYPEMQCVSYAPWAF